MFETLFSSPGVLRCHRAGPLAAERAAYLAGLAAQGAARATVLRRANYCLWIARELPRWPREHRFRVAEVEGLAAAWAAGRVAGGRAGAPRWPQEHFRFAALDFLKGLGRLIPPAAPPPGRYDTQLEEFIAAQRQGPWPSPATCASRRWHLQRFLTYLEQQGWALARLTAEHVDAYLADTAQTGSRGSLRSVASALRAGLRHGEARGWVRPGLADALLVPRIYRHAGLPLGPTGDPVGRLIAEVHGDGPLPLRDRAILLLLAIYGFRSGEVRRLRLDDVDWRRGRLRIVRSKSGRPDTLPLDPAVGHALARYRRHGRPESESRTLFLTVRAPFRPLSTGALYHVVQHRLPRAAGPRTGRGPHALRHACARRLVDAGLSLKEGGDPLGHRSPDATRLYAKVDLAALRRVALEDLGGLV
jgi:integrase